MTRGLFISGAHVDHKCVIDGPAIMGVSNPGKSEMFAGGGGLNAATTATALGVNCTMMGKIGKDANGLFVRETLERRGIREFLAEEQDFKTGTYTSIIGPDGDLIIAHADLPEYTRQDLVDLCTSFPDVFGGTDFWFTNANLQEDALEVVYEDLICFSEETRPRLALATISPAKAPRINSGLAHADYLFTNIAEASALLAQNITDPEKVAAMLCERVARGTMSNGINPVYFWENGEFDKIEPPVVKNVIDVTGAGDALAGATLAAHFKPLPFTNAVQCGLAAAALTVQSPLPYAKSLSWQAISAFMERN